MGKNIIALVCIIILVIFLLTACTGVQAPSREDVQEHFDNNKSNIQIVTDFLTTSGYENVYIDTTDGYMLADLRQIRIGDDAVVHAIKQLLSHNAYLSITKTGNTIYLLQWKSSKDVGCGVAFSVDNESMPEIEFATQLDALADGGWYYYVSDYNKWRTLHS